VQGNSRGQRCSRRPRWVIERARHLHLVQRHLFSQCGYWTSPCWTLSSWYHSLQMPPTTSSKLDNMSLMPPPTASTNLESSAPLRPVGRVEREKIPRQSFSCAECRRCVIRVDQITAKPYRLKLKCSRTWPCMSCGSFFFTVQAQADCVGEKRGCAQICPDGEMKTGKGKRLIMANTEEVRSIPMTTTAPS
jgi:hypothetical protein